MMGLRSIFQTKEKAYSYLERGMNEYSEEYKKDWVPWKLFDLINWGDLAGCQAKYCLYCQALSHNVPM